LSTEARRSLKVSDPHTVSEPSSVSVVEEEEDVAVVVAEVAVAHGVIATYLLPATTDDLGLAPSPRTALTG